MQSARGQADYVLEVALLGAAAGAASLALRFFAEPACAEPTHPVTLFRLFLALTSGVAAFAAVLLGVRRRRALRERLSTDAPAEGAVGGLAVAAFAFFLLSLLQPGCA